MQMLIKTKRKKSSEKMAGVATMSDDDDYEC
jgi:hypothetical protein